MCIRDRDWRHTKGRPWAPDSNGYWELQVGAAGDYDVRLRFPPSAAGSATLSLNDEERSAEILAGAEELSFEAIPLEAGPLRLQATLVLGDGPRGPWQVDVSRR